MELGLLTESSLKNISIRMLSDDRKIVKKNSLEYSINTTNFVSSWPFINDGRSKFKLDKNYMPNESKLKRRRKRRKKLSHKKKLSSNKKENQRIYKLRSSTINNNDNGNNNNNKRDNNKINNSLDSDSASEKSFEDYEENNVGNTVETNVGSLKPDWSYVDHKKEIKSVHLDNTKTHSNDSIKDDSGEAISVYSSNIKINKNKCERSKFDEIHDIPLAKRLSNEIKKENMVDNLSMCFRDYSSSSNLPGKNSNLSSAENKTIVDNNTSNTKKIEDIKVKKDNSFKNDFDEDDSDQNLRRVTRGLTKINKSVNENFLGRLVWGCCSGWWPALIIDAEHVGMVSEPGKLWVFWIGDSLISLLNEKTQIKPFTDNLELRLKQRSESTESMHCINLTIQMIREKCSSLLTKPYHIWIQKNFIDKTRKEIKFYPYPTKIQERLDFLKEKNSRINEKYMLDQKQQSSEKTKRQVEKCTDTSFNEKNTELLPLMEQRPGVIAWAKIAGYNWWPG
ncbi:DNA (cytosine-5)-methyltransferase 3B-like isoform X4 [Vespula squamosa]|uniref:DNA (Cytosine-5)-methyltransferase 3B-like isoform X4 n=1 Tax=Vespula squamosa TaxID=30214 RepID=A0ABD2AV75_VESSQ